MPGRFSARLPPQKTRTGPWGAFGVQPVFERRSGQATTRGRSMKRDIEIIDPLPLDLADPMLRRRLKVKNDRQWEDARALIHANLHLIHAKALYKISYLDGKAPDTVFIDGTEFTSRVLRKNLDAVERVFPFVVTIGGALPQKTDTLGDLMHKYYLDALGNLALEAARKRLEAHLKRSFALTGISYMSPGSLADWPLEAQRPLFSLFGSPNLPIGVQLRSSMLMVPVKSISGIYFPTEIPFYSCQLCPREPCPGRKAAYSSGAAADYGVGEGGRGLGSEDGGQRSED